MKINNREISTNLEPYIIAEISANHGGSIEKAKALISAACEAGASAVKLQTYEPESMTLNVDNPDFYIKGGTWCGYHIYRLYQDACTPWEWHGELFSHAKSLGITIFSTPFCLRSLEVLEALNCPAYKVASFELTDLSLIRAIARTGKPILLSTGMATQSEISDAIEVVRSEGITDLLVFHCVSSYPASVDSMNLRKIRSIRETFDVEVGLSDHSLGSLAAQIAVSMGASAIEKHFMLDDDVDTPDSTFSARPQEFGSLVYETRLAWKALGDGSFRCVSSEEQNLIFRRSLYYRSNLSKGDILTMADIAVVRPGYGLEPSKLSMVIGSALKRDVRIGDRVKLEDI